MCVWNWRGFDARPLDSTFWISAEILDLHSDIVKYFFHDTLTFQRRGGGFAIMFKNTFQSGFLSILYSIGSKPLQIWDKKVWVWKLINCPACLQFDWYGMDSDSFHSRCEMVTSKGSQIRTSKVLCSKLSARTFLPLISHAQQVQIGFLNSWIMKIFQITLFRNIKVINWHKNKEQSQTVEVRNIHGKGKDSSNFHFQGLIFVSHIEFPV